MKPTKVYMINGFEIPEHPPTPHELVLTWKNGKQTVWPAVSYQEALNHQHKIHLRPDLMQRIEVDGRPLWDADWVQHPFHMPPELEIFL